MKYNDNFFNSLAVFGEQVRYDAYGRNKVDANMLRIVAAVEVFG